jgi:hypothetical protein
VCGDEVSGNLDIVAEMFDTFYTQGPFATFTNKDTLNPDTNIRSARYSILETGTGTVVAQGTWFDHAATPLVCGSSNNANCILPGTNPDINAFLDRMATDASGPGAPAPGLQFVATLYDPASTSLYSQTNGEANRFNVPAFNNVTQRNLRVDSCNFQVTNATGSDGSLALRVVTDAAVESNDVAELRMPFVQAAFDAWSGTLGADLEVQGTELIVRMQVRDLTLPAFQLPAGVTLTVNLSLSLTGGSTRFVRLEPTFNGVPAAGFSCLGQGVVVPT